MSRPRRYWPPASLAIVASLGFIVILTLDIDAALTHEDAELIPLRSDARIACAVLVVLAALWATTIAHRDHHSEASERTVPIRLVPPPAVGRAPVSPAPTRTARPRRSRRRTTGAGVEGYLKETAEIYDLGRQQGRAERQDPAG